MIDLDKPIREIIQEAFNEGCERVQFLLSKKMYEESLKEIEKELRKNPNNQLCRILKAFALLSLNRPSEALGEVNYILRLDPSNAVAHALKAWALNNLSVLEDADYLDEALREIDLALSKSSDISLFHYIRGVILAGLGRYEESVRELDEALRLRPNEKVYREAKEAVLKYLNSSRKIGFLEKFVLFMNALMDSMVNRDDSD